MESAREAIHLYFTLLLLYITLASFVAHSTRDFKGAGSVCDKKTSKFFMSHGEESRGHMGVKGDY
jgi:hypothetical protein